MIQNFSNHFHLRCAQRNVDPGLVAFVKRHGRKVHRTGITFYFLGRRDIPRSLRRNDRYARLEGATLLVGPDGEVITAYRNREALKAIRRKAKYRLPSQSQ